MHLSNTTGGAVNYHAASVSPAWAPSLQKTTRIGNHIFYRTRPRRA
ncbi:MAG: cell wall hydrolase [Terriglobia bacterium]